MSHKRNEALRHVQHSMHHVIAAGEGSDRAPDSCKLCPYYRPDFKFRTCLYAHCPYKKQVNVFRSTPEKWDILYARKKPTRTADLDYFYGQQAELFSFYRVPKVLFTDEKFSNISSDAKLLYGIMLDRMNLSAKNGWVDELGRVYIIFTIEEVKGALGCAEKKAVKLLHELENKCGLIERKRIGLGKPNYIYVKNFVDNSVERQFLNCQKDNSGTVNKTLQELSKAQGNNTDIKDTDYSDTDPILSSDFSGRDVEKDEEFQSYYQYFYEELEMDYLFREFPYDKEVLESILEILVETVCSKRKLIRIASDDKPSEVVRSRLMKLNSEHIRYVLNCFKENTTKIRNPKQYALAALYNAPVTIDIKIDADVRHDMASGLI